MTENEIDELYADKMEKLLWIIEQDEAIRDFCNDLPNKFDKSEVEILDIHLMFSPKERYILSKEDTVTGTEIYKETLDNYVKTKKMNLIRDNVDNVLLEE